MKDNDKASWKRFVEVYRGQYGIYLDPRTAYQRCHELRYEQFGSAQGLLDAMHDYERIAPWKLTDETFESILWNKVPVELQKEVKEITDGSVQESLHRLLRAEAVLQERARRTSQQTSKKCFTGVSVKFQNYPSPKVGQMSQRKQEQVASISTTEMSLRRVKCFNSNQKAHLAKMCQEV